MGYRGKHRKQNVAYGRMAVGAVGLATVAIGSASPALACTAGHTDPATPTPEAKPASLQKANKAALGLQTGAFDFADVLQLWGVKATELKNAQPGDVPEVAADIVQTIAHQAAPVVEQAAPAVQQAAGYVAQASGAQDMWVTPQLPQTPQNYAGGTSTGNTIANAAKAQEGTYYAWGGASPSTGFDCSGLSHYAASQAGVDIPRTSQAQAAGGTRVTRDQLQPGDIVTYYGGSHSAVYIGEGKVVHSPNTGQTVQEADLDSMPIYTMNRYS